ncbi:MAG: acidic tetraheme cytochrome c3 TmcA [Pseudomonadota bacterium]
MKANKIALYIVAAGLASLFILGTAYAQDEIQWLEHGIFVGRERPAAAFSHALHSDDLGIDCLECHHIYENGENVWDDSAESDCTACHKLEAEGRKMPAVKAFHTNCQGCHKEEGKGPITCGECHPRKRQ